MHKPENIEKKMVRPLRSGELLVKEGFIRLDDIDMALSIQKRRRQSMSMEKNRLLGIILCDLNLITPLDNFYVLHKYNKLESIQSTLVSGRILSKAAAAKTRELSRAREIPYISLLLKTGQVSAVQMQKLLFELYHIPFRPVRDFSVDAKTRGHLVRIMDRRQSLERRVVPLLLKEHTLLFGITDPGGILRVRELNDRFPQYRFKVVFIPWSGFLKCRDMIYGSKLDGHQAMIESPDLSLLLKYRTSISDPGEQKGSIQTLYHHYEQLHHLSGGPKKESRLTEFERFIREVHQQITQAYHSRSIEFSLKKEDGGVKVMALPKIEDI